RAGAGLYVAPEFCGIQYDDAERARMREQQKQATVERGQMSAAQFDAAFDAGIEEARQAFANASPDELSQSCDAIRAMHAARPQGGAARGTRARRAAALSGAGGGTGGRPRCLRPRSSPDPRRGRAPVPRRYAAGTPARCGGPSAWA